MKLSCSRAAMTDGVNIVQKAVATRSTMPILEGILIKAKDNKIVLTGNDLEIGIECVIEGQVEQEGSVVVNARLFGDIVRKLSGETVYLDVNANQVTTIQCGNSKFHINGIMAEEFPEVPKFDIDFDLTLTQKQLKELVKHTIFAVGTSDSKLILTGCLLEASGNTVTMVAVDGFRLALKRITAETDVVNGYLGDVSIVIPSKTLNELTKILQDGDEQVRIYCSPKNIRFEFDNVIFTSRLLEGDYIDYKKIIPADFNTTVKTEVRPLIEAVERASLIITSEVTKSPVVVNVADGELGIHCETQAGRVEELVPVDMTGENLEIGFNNRYLLEALKAASGEQVTVSLIGSVNPCMITPADGDDFTFIVLPVRLKHEN